MVIVGLDGATMNLIKPWVEKGELPNIAKFFTDGATGCLHTVIPPSTAAAWTSCASGVNPAKHGLFEFMHRQAQSYDIIPVNSLLIKARRLWDILKQEGESSIVLHVPITYPATSLKGMMVTGILSPGNGDERSSSPPELLKEITSVIKDYRIMPTVSYSGYNDDRFLKELLSTVERKIKAGLYLMEKTDWTLFFQVFNETDFVQHAFWHYIDQEHPRFTEEGNRQYGEAILKVYQLIDAYIGKIQRPDRTLLIVSDHGAGPVNYYIHNNTWLLKQGLLRPKSAAKARIKHFLYRTGFTPIHAYEIASRLGLGWLKNVLRFSKKGYDVVEGGFFSFRDIDWSKSIAYSIGGGIAGLIYINLEGREPQGAVPRKKYDKTCEEVIRLLEEFRNPRIKERIVDKIYRRDEIFSGPYLEEAPDIVYFPKDPRYMVFSNFSFPSNQVIQETPPHISGQHRMKGILLMAGEQIKCGLTIEGASLLDITPTVLHLLGYPITKDIDGRVLTQALDDDFLRKNPIRYIDKDTGQLTEEFTYSDEEQEEIEKRLRSLGYL